METTLFMFIKASVWLCKAERRETNDPVSGSQTWQSRSEEESCSVTFSNMHAGHIYGIHITHIFIWGSSYIH